MMRGLTTFLVPAQVINLKEDILVIGSKYNKLS
jgi:hypothetical protein